MNVSIDHPICHLIKSSIELYYNALKTGKEMIDIACLTDESISLTNIDILDYIDILKFICKVDFGSIFWIDENLQNMTLKMLNKICQQNINLTVFKSVIPLLCSILSNLLDNFEECIDINYNLIEKIFDKFLINNEILYCMYDEINYLETLNDKKTGINNLCIIFKKYAIDKTKSHEKQILEMTHNLALLMNEKSAENVKLPIIYPFNYNWKITKIVNIKEIKSNSCPIQLRVLISNSLETSQYVNFLIKKDSKLRKEQLVSCMIQSLLYKLNRHDITSKKYDDVIPTYQVKMLTNDMGVIEFVENSVTIREIEVKGLTLTQYVTTCNDQEMVETTKDKYSNSLAVSSSLSYLLGLTDRHMDNIMINKKGQIFNIDYEYLFENPGTGIINCPNIKITAQMIDLLGGLDHNRCKDFINYLVEVYDIFRSYRHIIIHYYEIMNNEKLVNWLFIKNKLESRFLANIKSKNDITNILLNEIKTSNSIIHRASDKLHNMNIKFRNVFM